MCVWVSEASFFFSSLAEVYRAALLDLRAEAVPPAEGSERGLYWRNQLLQPHPDGHQLPAGQYKGCRTVMQGNLFI